MTDPIEDDKLGDEGAEEERHGTRGWANPPNAVSDNDKQERKEARKQAKAGVLETDTWAKDVHDPWSVSSKGSKSS